MRIVYIHQYYSDRARGGGTRSYEFARRLAARGHDVHMVTSSTDASGGSLPRWRSSVEDGITVHRLPVRYSNHMGYGRRLLAFVHFMIAASRQAVALRPELVLATSTPLTVVVPGLLAARAHRAPFVFEVRDMWPEVPIEIGALKHPLAQRLAYALARTAYRRAVRVIALSPGMADGVAAHGYPRDRICVVPNACDLDLFASVTPKKVAQFRASLPWLGSRPLVVYAGTIGTVNGLEYLVRVAAEAQDRNPEMRFLVVGKGRELATVERLADERGVRGKNLFFLPPVSKAEVPIVLGAADIALSLFLPLVSMRDNSANKFFDALAAGRPLALNYGGWQADILEHAGAGLALDPNDPGGAAQVLVDAANDSQWLNAAGVAARRLAEERFSRDLLFARFEQVLLDAAAEGPHLSRLRRVPVRPGIVG